MIINKNKNDHKFNENKMIVKVQFRDLFHFIKTINGLGFFLKID